MLFEADVLVFSDPNGLPELSELKGPFVVGTRSKVVEHPLGPRAPGETSAHGDVVFGLEFAPLTAANAQFPAL